MAKDFRSNQTRTNKIIGSGSNVSGGSPSLLIYSASSATDFDGSYEANMLSSVGSDAWLFVSGSDTERVVMGGDMIVSGTIYDGSGVAYSTGGGGGTPGGSDTQVQYNDGGSFGGAADLTFNDTTGDVTVGTSTGDAKLFFRDSGNYIWSETDGKIEIINADGTGDDAIRINASAGGLDIDAGTKVTINASDTAAITGSDAGTAAVQVYAFSGGVDIAAAQGVYINSEGAGLNPGINIGTATSGVPVSIGHTTSEVTVNDNLTVTGDLTVNGTTTTIDTNNLVIKDPLIYLASGTTSTTRSAIAFASGSSTANLALIFGAIGTGDTMAAARLDAEAGSATLDASSFNSLVPLRAAKFEVGGTTAYITQSVSGEMSIEASQVEIGIANGITNFAVTGSTVKFGNLSAEYGFEIPGMPGNDTFFFVSGSTGSRNSSTKGTAVVGGDLVVSGGVVINAAQETTTNGFTVYGGSNGSTSAISVSDSATSLNAQGATSRVVLTSLGSGNDAIRINSSGGVDIDADGEKPVNIAGGTVTLETNGDGTIPQQITLNTNVETDDLITIQNQAGTSASAIKVNASAGGIDIDAATGIDVNTTDLVITGSVEISANNDLISPALSGSLTHLSDGTSYLIAGSGISITSGSNGSVTITNDGTVGDITSVTAGTGLSGGGSSGDVTLDIDDSVVATVSGTTFTGDTVHQSITVNEYVTASLYHQLAGEAFQFLGAGASEWGGIDTAFYVSGAIGSKGTANKGTAVFGGDVVISGTLHGGSPLIIGSDVQITGTLDIASSTALKATAISGSLTKLTDGTSYLIAGTDIAITTGSNGAVTIASTGGGGGTPSAPDTSVQFNNGGSFGGNADFIFDDANSRLFTRHIAVNEYVTASLFTQYVGDAFQFVGDGGAENNATDIAFYVSGSKAGIDVDLNPTISNAAVMGGDLVVSGAIFGKTGAGGGTLNLVGGEALGGGNGSINAYVKGQNAFNIGTYEQTGYPEGTDVFFSVSGSIDGKISGTGVSVIGGDLVVSGAIYGGNTGFADELLLFGDSISLGDTEPGQDTFLYVSGAEGGKQSGNGVAVFGGDTVFSGTILNPGMSPDTGGSAVKFGSFNELFYETSDARIKTDINTIDAGLHKVQNLRGVTFRNSQREDSETEIGLIAQEVQAVVPEIVTTTPSGYLQVDYAKMVAVLIEAVKEQQSTIQLLESRILALEEK